MITEEPQVTYKCPEPSIPDHGIPVCRRHIAQAINFNPITRTYAVTWQSLCCY